MTIKTGPGIAVIGVLSGLTYNKNTKEYVNIADSTAITSIDYTANVIAMVLHLSHV